MRAFLPALLLFLSILAVAPAIGHVRDFIFEIFPIGRIRFLVAVSAVVAVVGLLVYAVVRIREHHWPRYGALLLVGGLLWVQTVGLATGQVKVDVVEKFHILEYGTLAFLIYVALLRRRAGTGDLSLLFLTFFGVTLAGIADEGVQWLVPQRTGEIRDVALNTAAGLSGLLFALALTPPSTWSWRLDDRNRRRLPRGAAATVLALGLFFYVAHLGYEIEDEEIGRFLSRFTADELRQLSARRAKEWGADPPTGLETWGIEDYFLSEAAWHANHRNTSYRVEAFTHAWLANRILEKYYDPFLDIESFRGSGRHRYPPSQRQELERKKGKHNPQNYLSPVAVGRIHPWSKPLFLTGLGVVVVALWAAARRSTGRRR